MAEHPRNRPFSLSEGDIAQLRAAFAAADLREQSVAGAVGVETCAALKTVPAELAFRRTSADTPLNALVRLFVIGAPIEREAAQKALAPAPIDRLIAGGLLVDRGASVSSSVMMVPFDGLIIAFDRSTKEEEAPDFVMGPSDGGRATVQILMLRPGLTCLEIGTGCGWLALVAARTVGRVVATDLNPRSKAFVELNAALNGIGNVEAVTGDLFEPVADRKFDLVFSFPPYVISPDHHVLFKSGGMKGDSFCRKLAAGVGPVLRDGGHFQMMSNWVEGEGEDWAEFLRAWFEGSGCDAWVLRSSTTDPRTYALHWMESGKRGQTEEPAQRLKRWLAYYEQEGIRAIGAGMVTMKKRREGREGGGESGREGWLRAVDAPPRMLGQCGDMIRERMEALDLLQRTADDALMETVFTASPNARLIQECEPTAAGWAQKVAHVTIDRGLAYVEEIDTYFAELIVACDGRRTLREAIQRALSAMGAEPGSEPEQTAEIVRQLVEEGFLLPARARAGEIA